MKLPLVCACGSTGAEPRHCWHFGCCHTDNVTNVLRGGLAISAMSICCQIFRAANRIPGNGPCFSKSKRKVITTILRRGAEALSRRRNPGDEGHPLSPHGSSGDSPTATDTPNTPLMLFVTRGCTAGRVERLGVTVGPMAHTLLGHTGVRGLGGTNLLSRKGNVHGWNASCGSGCILGSDHAVPQRGVTPGSQSGATAAYLVPQDQVVDIGRFDQPMAYQRGVGTCHARTSSTNGSWEPGS